MIKICDCLVVCLGYKLLFEWWLKVGNLFMVELKEIIVVGKFCWVKLIGLNVKEFE